MAHGTLTLHAACPSLDQLETLYQLYQATCLVITSLHKVSDHVIQALRSSANEGVSATAFHLPIQQSMILYNYTPELEHNGFHVHHTSITNNMYECMCMLMQCITLHSRELFTYVRTHVLHVDMLKCGFFHNYINLPLHSCRLTHRYVSWNMVYFPRKTVSSMQLASYIMCTCVRRN